MFITDSNVVFIAIIFFVLSYRYINNSREKLRNYLINFSCWLVWHGAFGVAEVFSLVHAQTSSSAAESIALGSELSAIALFAEEFTGVLSSVGAVQSLVAKTALEAVLVPFVSSGQHFFGGINGLLALGADRLLNGRERHLARRMWLAVCLRRITKLWKL